jgi:hypothetical protein
MKTIRFSVLNIFLHSITIGITSLVFSTAVNSAEILNGFYFQSPPRGDYEGIEVSGNHFHFVYEGTDHTDPVDPWKNASQLRHIRKGVILHKKTYFCSRKIYPNNKYCARSGGKGRYS